jgi:hypothetical protein
MPKTLTPTKPANKAKPTNTVTTKTPQKVVRITIDAKLQDILDNMQNQYPLLSNTDLIKVLMSNGYKNQKTGFMKAVEIAKSVQVPKEYQNLTEDEQFEVLAKFDLL